MKIYAMEPGFLDRLLADRRELLSYARTLGTSEAMRAARADLMASTPINVTPSEKHPLVFQVVDGVAHIPIVGELTPRAETDACGAYTAEALTEYGFITAAIDAAESSPEVESIVFDVNSPGGYVSGLDPVAQRMSVIGKPTAAHVGDMAASAAYYLASQADRIVALSPASRVGSIGVAAEEYDVDGALEKEGITHRVYTSTDAPDKRPDTKTPEGRAKVVAELDALHSIFVRRVASGRRVSEEKVSKDFGRGGVLIAEKALAAGMIDEVVGSHLSRKTAVVDGSAAAEAAISQQEGPMDQELLKAEYDKGVQAGIEGERARVAKLSEFKGLSPTGDKLIDEAIASGAEYLEIAPKLTAATAKAQAPAGDNPPVVATALADTASGAEFSAEDIEAMRMFGMTTDEYRKYSKKGGN